MKNKETLKLGLILLIITAIAGLILGAANKITKEPIAKQIEKTNSDAMREIVPGADKFNVSDVKPSGEILEINEGKNSSDKTVGYAIKVAPKGYSGKIEMMVGISKEGKVNGIKILSHSETPGLGANAPQPKFSGQYKGKSIDTPFVVVKRAPSASNEIEAITGSTITSKGVTKGVNDAVSFYNEKLKGDK